MHDAPTGAAERPPAPIEAALALAPLVRARANEAEARRSIPRDVMDALASAGMFRLLVPRELGGLETDPLAVMRALELVSTADGSTGWCTMIGAASNAFSGYLPERMAREMFGANPDVYSGGVFAPSGHAVPAAGGYTVWGRWALASGCQHCTWLFGGAIAAPATEAVGRVAPVAGLDAGPPRSARLMFFPASDVRILDTWHAAGLQGTGSHDFVVDAAFVPHDRTLSLSDRPWPRGTLWRVPPFSLGVALFAVVPLGIGRAALDAIRQLAPGKIHAASGRRLLDREYTQAQLARAEGVLRAGRAFLYEAMGELWQAARDGLEISLERRALVRLAAIHATRAAVEAVDAAYELGGGSAVYASSPLQRAFRDVHAAKQHPLITTSNLDRPGRVLLGLDTDDYML